MEKFPLQETKEDFYLGAGRMVPYKKFDLLVETFLQLPEKKLVLIGDGPERKSLEKMAAGASNIQFLGRVSDEDMTLYFGQAQAFILPQKEDAGIVQLEAMSSGTPVIAYKAGGALDVITENERGVFFEEQTSDALMRAIENFELKKWDYKKIHEETKQFNNESFVKNFCEIVERRFG
ncbi:group 1 family glycosyl transferase [Candidatus Peregrinibacteria bacterium]|nr:MAG: group 1 family glycosyl transferase [Candidatus Peregrinibacteria bacterium]